MVFTGAPKTGPSNVPCKKLTFLKNFTGVSTRAQLFLQILPQSAASALTAVSQESYSIWRSSTIFAAFGVFTPTGAQLLYSVYKLLVACLLCVHVGLSVPGARLFRFLSKFLFLRPHVFQVFHRKHAASNDHVSRLMADDCILGRPLSI